MYTRESLLYIQNESIKELASLEEGGELQEIKYTIVNDPVSTNNLCDKDHKDLQEINLRDLSAENIQEDTILWVKTISRAFHCIGINLVVEDKNGDAIAVCLYEQIKKKQSLS